MNENGLLLIAAVVIGFLALRTTILWYWRINAIHDRLTEIRDELRLIRSATSPATSPTTTAPTATANAATGTPIATASRKEAPVDRLLRALRPPIIEDFEPEPNQEAASKPPRAHEGTAGQAEHP